MHLSSSVCFAASQVDKRHLDRDKQIIYIYTVYLQYLADNSFSRLWAARHVMVVYLINTDLFWKALKILYFALYFIICTKTFLM